MKTWMPILALAVAVVVLLLVRRTARVGVDPAVTRNPRSTLEQKLAVLAGGGFRLAEPFTGDDLLEAWLSFSFQGRDIKIPCEVTDDWVDPNVFSRFVELLAQSDPSKIYVSYDLGGQDCLLGCVAKEDLTRLNRGGIRFVPLK